MYRIIATLAIALCLLGTAGCQTPFDRGGPGVQGVLDCPTDGSQCNCGANKCRVRISIANCATSGTATVLSGPIRVANGNNHTTLVWLIDPPQGNNWIFRQGTGVALKDAASDPTGQFYEKCPGNNNDNCDPSVRTSKRYRWKDVNMMPAGANNQFDYNVLMYDDPTSPTAKSCKVDPQIFNDG